MDSVEEFISSGIIEMYCMGLTSEAETAEVVRYATLYKEVSNEILQVTESLTMYAASLQQKPKADLRSRILQRVGEEGSQRNLPPKLFENPSVAFWGEYLTKNGIEAPAEFDPFYLAELPSEEKQYTYVAWAKQGASLEETHDDEDEWLFVFRGTCTMTIDGKVTYHKAGDLILVKPKQLHKAEATSAEPMILIGQRLAA